MDFAAAATDPAFLAIVGGHILVLFLAVFLTALRRYSAGGFFAWLATIASLLFGLFWSLVLGGGRKNSQADESVQFALDPNGGRWITVYIVGALIVAYGMTWICKRGREKALAAKAAPIAA